MNLRSRLRLTTMSPSLVTVPPRAEVEWSKATEQDPREVDLSHKNVDAIWNSVLDLYQSGLHPAIGMCVRRRGRVIIDRAVGHERGNEPGADPDAPKVRATPDTLFNLFSATKSITAMLIHKLDDQGLLHLDDSIMEYIPEFDLGGHAKRHITIRHVLTHRAGIPAVPGDDPSLDVMLDQERVIQLLCEARSTFRAGRRLAYHALTGGFILGEIIQRVTGKNVRQLLAQEVLDPLGFEHHNYGVDPSLVDKVAVHAYTGAAPLWPYSELLRRSIGIDIRAAAELSNDPRYITGIVPSGNIIATANEACRFFQLLLNEGELDGKRIFEERTVRRAVSEQSYLEVDATLILPIRYGMGFMLGAKTMSFYGPNTRYAFGHLGFTNLLVWADRERDISVSMMTTGKPFLTPRLLSWFRVMFTICGNVPRDREVLW